MKETKKSTKNTAAADQKADGFTDLERAAMKDRAQELKSASRGGGKKADQEAAVLAKIAEMSEPDRAMAERFHAIVLDIAPELAPKLWYGMPGYAKNGKVVVFFQSGQKFEERYSTIGFNSPANLDDGRMWPTAFALTKLTAVEEEIIGSLVKKAVS